MSLQVAPQTEEKTCTPFLNSTPVLLAVAGENHKIRAHGFM